MRIASGLFFIGLSALFYCTRWVCAGLICAGFSSASRELFNAAYGYVGPTLTVFSLLSLLIGAAIIFYPQRDRLQRFALRLWDATETKDPE